MSLRDKPWSIMDPVRGRIRLAMVLSVCSSLAGLLSLGLLAAAVAAAAGGASDSADQSWTPWAYMAGVLASTIAAFVLRIASFNTSHYAAFRLETLLRTRLAAHLARIAPGQVQDYGTGALAKVLYDDVRALHVFVADSTPLYARAYAMPVASFAILLWLDWRLAAAAASVIVFGFGVLAFAMRNFREMSDKYNAAREQVSASVVEFVQAMPVVRTFDTGHQTFGRYQRALERYLVVVTEWYRGSAFSARFSIAVLGPLPTLFALVWLGTWLEFEHTLGVSAWLAALLIGAGMAEAMMPMMTLSHMVNRAKLSIVRIGEVLEASAMPEPAAETGRTPADASVTFENVGFRYGDGPAALNDVSFRAPACSVTALVGASGSGKTTVTRLVARFWDACSGRVLIGGVDVRDMETDMLMATVSTVFQDAFLFAGSLADNIRLGTKTASMDQVIAAAKAAQVHDFIAGLPDGYETIAGERGVLLSGGQRQRMTIARAILQDRPIVILDEATAFVDPETEAALLAALSSLMRGRTVIIVAHRLSVIRSADQILVFDAGRLVETGRHEDLVARAGVYARLWECSTRARRWALGAARGDRQ